MTNDQSGDAERAMEQADEANGEGRPDGNPGGWRTTPRVATAKMRAQPDCTRLNVSRSARSAKVGS
jgi:hypothetical protein